MMQTLSRDNRHRDLLLTTIEEAETVEDLRGTACDDVDRGCIDTAIEYFELRGRALLAQVTALKRRCGVRDDELRELAEETAIIADAMLAGTAPACED